MKNRVITGISTAILGVLIACIPNFILTIGPHCRIAMMECVYTAKAEYGIGVTIVFLAVLLGFAESREIRLGISTGLGFVGILAALIATVLMGFCDGSCNQCACNPLTAPLMAALGILVAVISFINVFYLSRTKHN